MYWLRLLTAYVVLAPALSLTLVRLKWQENWGTAITDPCGPSRRPPGSRWRGGGLKGDVRPRAVDAFADASPLLLVRVDQRGAGRHILPLVSGKDPGGSDLVGQIAVERADQQVCGFDLGQLGDGAGVDRIVLGNELDRGNTGNHGWRTGEGIRKVVGEQNMVPGNQRTALQIVFGAVPRRKARQVQVRAPKISVPLKTFPGVEVASDEDGLRRAGVLACETAIEVGAHVGAGVALFGRQWHLGRRGEA